MDELQDGTAFSWEMHDRRCSRERRRRPLLEPRVHAHVQSLLDRAYCVLARCQPWLPIALYNRHKGMAADVWPSPHQQPPVLPPTLALEAACYPRCSGG